MLKKITLFIISFVFFKLAYSQQVDIKVSLCKMRIVQKKVIFNSTGSKRIKMRRVRIYVFEYQVYIFNDDTVAYFLPINRTSIINKNVLSKIENKVFTISNKDTLIVKEKRISRLPVNKRKKVVLLYYLTSLREEHLEYFTIFLKILPQSSVRIFYYKAIYSPLISCTQEFKGLKLRRKYWFSKYRYPKKSLIVLRLYGDKYKKDSILGVKDYLFDAKNVKDYFKETSLYNRLENCRIYSTDTIYKFFYK